MKSTTARRRYSYTPRLDALEDRWCPAVTMRVLDGHILEVMGDQGNNQVFIIAIENNQVSATGDGSTPQTFTGIDAIRVNTWAGDDAVHLTFMPDNHSMPRTNFAFDIDLGAGNDAMSFALLLPPGPCQPIDQLHTIRLTANGGLGNDSFNTYGGGSETGLEGIRACLGMALKIDLNGEGGTDSFFSDFRNVEFDAPVSLMQHGGEGNDLFQNNFANVFLPAVQRSNSLSAMFDGGAGDDHLASSLLGRSSGDIGITMTGGEGNDDLAAICGFNPQPDPPAKLALALEGGAGDDSIMVDSHGSNPADQVIAIQGGTGKDDIRVICDFNPQPDPPAKIAVRMDGGAGDDVMSAQFMHGQVHTLDCVMMGGDGNDGISMTTDFTPQTSSELPAVQFNLDIDGGLGNDAIHFDKHGATAHREKAVLHGGEGNDIIAVSVAVGIPDLTDTVAKIDMDGGRSNDVLSYFDLPTDGGIILGYSYELTMHGGAGNDFLVASVSYVGPAHAGDTASIKEYGDAGDDQLFLFAPSGPFAALLMDGGSGIDIGLSLAHHTANVTVVNCEL